MSPPLPSRADLLARRPRARRVFSEADMERLHDLYFDRTMPFPKIAAAFAVSSSTLSQCLAEMGRRGARPGTLPFVRRIPLPKIHIKTSLYLYCLAPVPLL